jgi:hypothetical protein
MLYASEYNNKNIFGEVYATSESGKKIFFLLNAFSHTSPKEFLLPYERAYRRENL